MIKPVRYTTHSALSRQHAKELGYVMLISTMEWAYFMEVDYYVDFPRNKHMQCAFCAGDPLNIMGVESNINYYYEHTPAAKICPVCEGRT